MTWICRLIENPELNAYGNVDTSKREIGDMWFLDIPTEDLKDRALSDQYFAANSHRQPLVVMLPGRNCFCVDGKCYSPERGSYGGWTVTGAPPNITVAPSINMVDRYHGFLQNGVIGDPL